MKERRDTFGHGNRVLSLKIIQMGLDTFERSQRGQVKLDIYYLSLILIVATIALPIRINHLAIVISIPCWFALFTKKENWQTMLRAFTKNRTALFFLILSLFIVVSSLIHFAGYDDVDKMLKTIEKRISFLWFPLLLSGVVLLSKSRIRKLILVYVYSMVLISALCLIIGLFVTIKTGTVIHINPENGVLENNFMYHRQGSYIGLHAVFFAAFNLLALVILLVKLLSEWATLQRNRKLLYGSIIVFLGVEIFLLSSIAISIIFLLLFTVILGHFILLRVKRKRIFIGLVLVILMISTGFGINIIRKLDIKKSLFGYNFSDYPGSDDQNWNALNLRMAMWEITLDALDDYWILGVGPSNMQPVLDSYYEKYDFQFGMMNHFNPHNQFLHTFLMLGIGGFIILIMLMYSIFSSSIKNKDIILVSLFTIFILFSMTASTLAVNKGIVFFTFFFTFLTYLERNTSSYLSAE